MQVISSSDGPLSSLSPDARQLQQQLLDEKKISAELRGELTRV